MGEPFVVDLGMAMVWLIPAALVVGLEGRTPAAGARIAFLSSFLAHAAFFYWFLVVTMVYAGMPAWLGMLAPLLPALYVAPFTAGVAWAWLRFEPKGSVAPLVGGALWVGTDWVRSWLLSGFPWATLGYALHGDVPLLSLTRWTGVYGLSFVASAAGIAIARFWLTWRETGSVRDAAWRGLVATSGLVLALHLTGPFGPDRAGDTRAVRVAAIQGNVDQGQKWDPARREQILSRYLALSAQAVEAGADWVVWPETAVPGLVENDSALRWVLDEFARRHGVSLLVGGTGVEIDRAAARFTAFYDSAFLFDPDQGLVDRYDKTHLVPFGEYLPLGGLFGEFLQAIATGLSSGDVTAGPRPRNLSLGWPEDVGARDPTASRVLVGVPICYELLFPDLVRRFAGEGAAALLAITNDAWYGRTGAPYQFLAMTVIRAAETGLPVVRAANSGVSALIDARGGVEKRSRLFEEAIVVGDISLRTGGEPTFYARFGDVFVALCGIGWLLFACRAWLRERGGHRAGTIG
jgi:apolipoprotein N-acyltransferase